ncbi:hypothetical protein V8C42DRAFT_323560 [Trichoderma barbatum]
MPSTISGYLFFFFFLWCEFISIEYHAIFLHAITILFPFAPFSRFIKPHSHGKYMRNKWCRGSRQTHPSWDGQFYPPIGPSDL